MTLDHESCLRALAAHDPRFDGVFFVGVKSTRIYCRPVCPARPVRRDRLRFYANAAAAERAGFRPCLRCRPELAPGLARIDATVRVARVAAQRIADGALNGRSVSLLAAELGVGARQLRRVVESETGVTPIALAQTHRLLMAKRLLTDTHLSMTQVAFASGFQSVRRFDALFQERYRMAPSALRKKRSTALAVAGEAPIVADGEFVTCTLGYRPPYDWQSLLGFLAARATPGVEAVDPGHGGTYARTIAIDGHQGIVSVCPAATDGAKRPRKSDATALRVRISLSLTPVVMPLLARLRQLFDLDAEPDAIAQALEESGLGRRDTFAPGLRVPGSVNGFELALRAVLGQQVSVKGATTLAGRFATRFGQVIHTGDSRLTVTAPLASAVSQSTVAELMTLGVTGARATSILELSRAVHGGALRLEPDGQVSDTMKTMMALPGIGDWTAQYIAMRALRWPDAFPASDLWLRRAAGNVSEARLRRASERWSPWRSYAAMQLWHWSANGTAPIEVGT